MEHTKEPWAVAPETPCLIWAEGGRVCIGAADAPNNRHAPGEAKANARRIVICVNACEGLSNETLEGQIKTLQLNKQASPR